MGSDRPSGTTDTRRSRRARGARASGDPSPDEARSLESVGLQPGEAVRWQRKAGGHWHEGVAIRREADGSVAVRDADGAWRSIVVDRLEARRAGRRGPRAWEPLAERAERAERAAQLTLWS